MTWCKLFIDLVVLDYGFNFRDQVRRHVVSVQKVVDGNQVDRVVAEFVEISSAQLLRYKDANAGSLKIESLIL